MNVHKDFLKVAVLLLSCYIFIFALQGKAGDCFASAGSNGRNGGSSAERSETSALRLTNCGKQHVASAGLASGACSGSPVTSVRPLDDVPDEEVKDFIRSFHRSVVLMTNELDVSEEEIGRYLDLQDEKMRIMQNMLLDDVFRTKCQLFEHPELVDADLVEFQGSLYKKWHIERSENRITADVFEEHDLASWPQEVKAYALKNGIYAYPEYPLLRSGYKRYELELRQGQLKICGMQADEETSSSTADSFKDHIEKLFACLSQEQRDIFESFFYQTSRNQMKDYFRQNGFTLKEDQGVIPVTQKDELDKIKDFLMSYHSTLEKMLQNPESDLSQLTPFVQKESSTWKGLSYLLQREHEKCPEASVAAEAPYYPEMLLHRYQDMEVKRFGPFVFVSVYEEHLVRIDGREVKTEIGPLPNGLMNYLLSSEGGTLKILREEKMETREHALFQSQSPVNIGSHTVSPVR